MIHVLEDRVINKIAAGEVVERPASVVKELVENALDAGARDLRVELKGGGRSMIRVIDDGAGMDEHDAALSIERHATSKIKDDEDLFRVGTLGFRGEALPSIAAVSRFELVTRTRDREAATRVMVEGGRLVAVEAAGGPAGTDVMVRSLFFNVPARRKFLRSTGTELGHCLEAIVREALVRPALDIEVRHEGELSIRAPVVPDRATRAADLLGEHGKALVPLAFADRGLDVDALVSPVGVHKGNPQGATYLYVNGRYVRDAVLRAAVNDAYRGIVPKGRYPTIVLALALDPAQVDVNVHPAKTEVRFRNPRDVQECIAEGLRAGLEQHGIKRPVVIEARYAPPAASNATPLFDRRPSYAARPAAPAPFARTLALREPNVAPAPVTEEPPLHENRDLLPVERYRDLIVLGQLAHTYILCEGGGELVIIDQHAAHERITLHRLKHRPEGRLGSGQQQLAPVVVDLPPASARAVEPHLSALEKYGIEIAAFGGTSFAIQQVPEALLGKDLIRLFHDVADDLVHGNGPTAADDAIEHLLSTMACRSSVKAGQSLSAYEMRSLLGSLDGVDFSVCAHGRPVAIRVSVDELERRFHRT
jgi:DNA mismatch repair protein MutL